MTDIVLRVGEPNPNDIKLSDPTVVGSTTFSYVGQIDGVSGIGASYCKGKTPVVAVAASSSFMAAAVSKTKDPDGNEIDAVSTITSLLTKGKVPSVRIDALSTITAALVKVKVPTNEIDAFAGITAALAKSKVPPVQIDAVSTQSAHLEKVKVPAGIEIDSGSTVAASYSFTPGVAGPSTFLYAGEIDALSTVLAATEFHAVEHTYAGEIDAVADITAATSFVRQLTEEEGRAVPQHYYPEGQEAFIRRPRPVVVRYFDSETGIEIPRAQIVGSYGFVPVPVVEPSVYVYTGGVRARERKIAATYSPLNVSVYEMAGAVAVKKHSTMSHVGIAKNFEHVGEIKRRGHRLENKTNPLEWRLYQDDLDVLRLMIGEL